MVFSVSTVSRFTDDETPGTVGPSWLLPPIDFDVRLAQYSCEKHQHCVSDVTIIGRRGDGGYTAAAVTERPVTP
jgi:hypothetical protein